MPHPVRSSGPGPAVRFRPPARQAGAIDRTRVSDAIVAAVSAHSVTVVSAPSGFGKTIAVADWAAGVPDVAWLSLSSLDSDPHRLAQGVVHALITASSDGHQPRLALDPEMDDPRDAYRAICDALDAADRLLHLVVDDAQRAGEDWQDGLLGALAEQPPAGLKLVLVGTTLLEVTLSRQRIMHPESFVGAEALAFTAAEVERLRGPQVVGLASETIVDETQGWPIAVRLMLIGGERPDSARTSPTQIVGDYVRDHVLRALPDGLADFVLASAVCVDITPELATAVTERTDAAEALESCVKLGLFLDRFETSRGPVYRWHSFFARQCVVILNAADPDRLADLHRRAAAHLERDDPLASIAHSRYAGDAEIARATLLRNWVGLVVGPSAGAVDRACTELLARFPDDAGLALVKACAVDVLGQHRVARELFAHAEALAAQADASGPDGWILPVARLFLVDERSDASRASADVRGMLQRIDAAQPSQRAAIQYLLGWTEIRHRTDSGLPIEYFTASAREAESRGDNALARRALGHLAFAFTWAGRLREARETLSRLEEDQADPSPWSYYAGGSAAAAAAYVAYWGGDIDAASREFGRVIAAGSSNISFAGVARMMLALSASESGDVAACRRAAIGIQDIPREEAHGVSWPAFRECAVAMLEEAAGDRERALRIARKYVGVGDLPVVCVALAGVLRRAGAYAEALETLRALRSYAEISYVKVATLTTAALGRRQSGDLAGAHDLCEAALEIAAPESIRLPFGHRESELRRLLRDHVAHGTHFEDFIASCLADESAGSVLEALSERERAVYQQLQTARTLAEIAEELRLSINTVKTHQRSIYRKLGVSSRREAVHATV